MAQQSRGTTALRSQPHLYQSTSPDVSGPHARNAQDRAREGVMAADQLAAVQELVNRMHVNPMYDSNESSEDGNRLCSRARHSLSCSRLVNIVKETVVMATLITSLALILVHVNTPHPGLNKMNNRSAFVWRLENEVVILEECQNNLSAWISRLEKQESGLVEYQENCPAIVRSLEIRISALEERPENRSAATSRLEDRESSLGESQGNPSAPGIVLESKISLIEERVNNHSVLISRSESQELNLGEYQDCSALVSRLMDHIGILEKRLENGSTLVKRLEKQISDIEERLQDHLSLESHALNVKGNEDKLSILGGNEAACRQPLGMECGSIPDASITASSYWGADHEPYYARLNGEAGAGAWAARTSTIGQWLQVDLGQLKRVTGTIIQGRQNHPHQWVTAYKLQHRADGACWSTYADRISTEKVFPGNSDRDTPVTNLLDRPVDARYVRFLPQAWREFISMKAEVLGCCRS